MPRMPPPKLFALVTCLAAFAGCGGAEPHPTPSVAVPAASSSPAPVATVPALAPVVPATAAPRTASAEIRRYWTFGDRGRMSLYGDIGGLLQTDLARAFVPSVIALVKGTITDDQARCLQSAAQALREIAFGADDSSGMLLVRFDDQAFQPSTCLASTGVTKVQLEGATEAYRMKDAVLAYVPGVFLIGPEHTVTTALSQAPGATSFPARLALAPDEYLTWSANVDEELRAHGTLTASNERFRLSFHADMPKAIAERGEKELHGLRGASSIPGLDGPEGELALKLLQSVELTRSGGHIDAAFDLHEPPADQSRDLGAIASLAIQGVRKYLAESKVAEARNTLGQIARDYVTWWEREDGTPRAKKRLASLPPVPKTVPRGVKYASKEADWKPWARLKFSMDEPQYYQYEVKAAPDGLSANILARGDLNGDGKTSLFRLPLRVDRAAGNSIVMGSIEETDPQE
jgi:type IV pilus assembly protein PilA